MQKYPKKDYSKSYHAKGNNSSWETESGAKKTKDVEYSGFLKKEIIVTDFTNSSVRKNDPIQSNKERINRVK